MNNIEICFEQLLNNEKTLKIGENSFSSFLALNDINLKDFLQSLINKDLEVFISWPSINRKEIKTSNQNLYNNFFIKINALYLDNQKEISFYIKGDFVFSDNKRSCFLKVSNIFLTNNELLFFEKKETIILKPFISGKKTNLIFVQNLIKTLSVIYSENVLKVLENWEFYLEFEKQFFNKRIGFYELDSYEIIELNEVIRNIDNLEKFRNQIYYDDKSNYLYLRNNNQKFNTIAIEFNITIKNDFEEINKLISFSNEEIEIASKKDAIKDNKLINFDLNLDVKYPTKKLGPLLKEPHIVYEKDDSITYKLSYLYNENSSYLNSYQIKEELIKKFSEDFILVNLLSGDISLYKRGKEALNQIKEGDLKNPSLLSFLFNIKSHDNINLTNEIKEFSTYYLDDYQKKAVNLAVNSNSIFLIQGPPGTGKTQTISEIVYQLNKLNKKVLISSQTHIAIDNVLERLPNELNVLPIRLITSKRIQKANRNYFPDKIVDNLYQNIIENYNNKINYLVFYQQEIDNLNRELKTFSNLINKLKEVRENYFTNINTIESKKEELSILNQKNIKLLNEEKIINNNLLFIYEFEKSNYLIKDYDINNVYINLLKDIKEIAIERKFNINYDLDEFSLNDFFKVFSHHLNDNKFNIIINNLIKDNIENISIQKENLKDKQLVLSNKLIDIEHTQNKILNEINRLESLNFQTKENYKNEFFQLEEFFDKYLDKNINKIPVNDKEKFNIIKEKINSKISYLKSEESNSKMYFNIYQKTTSFLKNISDESIEFDKKLYSKTLLDNNANVFGITCNASSSYLEEKNDYLKELGLGNINLNLIDFDVVIIDEVSKANFVELLIPVLYGKSIILVGDHRQLPPIFKYQHINLKSNKIDNTDFEKIETLFDGSFFKDLFYQTKNNKLTLLNQYRSHEQIMQIVNLFYENKLLLGNKEEQNESKKHNLEFLSPINNKYLFNKNIHTYWINSHIGIDEQVSYERKILKGSKLSTSFYNQSEIDLIIKILLSLDISMNEDKSDLSIGVISFYKDQINLIQKELRNINFKYLNKENIKIATVDEFQGKEEDIIIVSFVRNNKANETGEFSKKFERINVALSRARKMLFILGSKPFFNNLNIKIHNLDNDGYEHRYIYKEIYNKCRGKIDFPFNYFSKEKFKI